MLAEKRKKDAEAKAIKKQAEAAERTSKASEWQVIDNKQLTESGAQAWINVGGKSQRVYTVRVNKVTGAAFDLEGHRIDKFTYTDAPSSAKQASSPIYQLIKIDGSGFNSSMNAPTLTIPADGVKINNN